MASGTDTESQSHEDASVHSTKGKCRFNIGKQPGHGEIKGKRGKQRGKQRGKEKNCCRRTRKLKAKENNLFGIANK